MSWIEIERNAALSVSDLKKPFIGFYIGSRTEKIQDPERGMRETKLHLFINDSGLFEFWGFLDFDLKIKKVIPGNLTQIVYRGMENIEGSDKKNHLIKLLHDPEKKLSEEDLKQYKNAFIFL